jgi:hypothetical protein
MAMTNAEKQAAFRKRRDARIREMEEQLRNHSEAPKAVRGADEREEIAGLRAELEAVQRTLGLAMLKAQNKRLARGESIALVKVEEPPRENAALNWRSFDHKGDGDFWMAETHTGAYSAGCDDAGEGFVAALLPWNRSGTRRLKRRPLGNFGSLDEAKAACQEHARAITQRGSGLPARSRQRAAPGPPQGDLS